jgi:hypothetical protein
MSLSVRAVGADGPDPAPEAAELAERSPDGQSRPGFMARLGRRLQRWAARRYDRLPPRLQRRLPDLGAFAAYLLLALWIAARLWRDPYRRVSAHLPNDHIQFEWWLTHSAYSLVHLHNPFLSDQLNVPYGVNMIANTSVLGVGLPLAPVTLLFGPQVSYEVWVTLALALSALTCYYVFSRHLVRSRLAAAVGAGFFGFAPGIVHHANGQPNFVSNFLLPLIVLRVAKLREPGRVIRNAVILALLVCWQLFINEELLILTAAGSVAMVLCYAVMRPAAARQAARPFLLGSLLSVGIALPLLAYPIWFQFAGPQHYHGIPNVFTNWGEDVTAYFTFARDTLAGNFAVEQTIGRTEQNSWFGAPLVFLILIMVFLLWKRSRPARIAVIVGTVFAVLALGPYVRFNGKERSVPGPWQFLENVPLIRFMYPSRLVYVVIAGVAVLLAVACDTLPRLELRGSPLRFRSMWAIAVAVALVPIIPKPLPTVSAPDVPAFISQGTWKRYVDSRHSLVTVPLPSNTVGLKAVLWNVVAMQEYAIPRGYFLGPDERGVGKFGAPHAKTDDLIFGITTTGKLPEITDRERENARADLWRWRAAIVVLDPMEAREQQLWLAVTDLTGITPRYVDGVWVWDVRPLVDGPTR